jgi:hypothetical protein
MFPNITVALSLVSIRKLVKKKTELQKEEIHNFYYSPINIRAIYSQRG